MPSSRSWATQWLLLGHPDTELVSERTPVSASISGDGERIATVHHDVALWVTDQEGGDSPATVTASAAQVFAGGFVQQPPMDAGRAGTPCKAHTFRKPLVPSPAETQPSRGTGSGGTGTARA
jgi:hypothetical protein